jgi:hypothetical protein
MEYIYGSWLQLEFFTFSHFPVLYRKKVKLVRMPQLLKEGEKLDPCVRLLLDSNGNNAANMIGVVSLEIRFQQEP